MKQRLSLAVPAAALLLAGLVGPGRLCLAREEPAPAETGCLANLCRRDSLTGDWFGLGRTVAESGLSVHLGLTEVYQLNLEGGLATHRHAGRYAGSYDLEAELDLEKLFRITGGTFFVLAEGSWSDGLDASSVGSLLGINDDAAGDRAIDVTEAWYEQALLGGRLIVRIGKIDLTGGFECRGCPVAFDASLYANDETTQFLASALVNNPTIPFPDNGLGAAVYLEPAEGFYLAAGAQDAQADARETGFRTAFHEEDHVFAIFETGLVPNLLALPGAYRAGFWYDPQPKERFRGGVKRDDVGLYLSCDQMLHKENTDADDTQGLGVFARFGCADSDVNEIHSFWSAGGQVRGLIPGRDDDVLALGVAQGLLSRDAEPGRTSRETVLEMYYSAAVCGWLNVSGHLQYVDNPGVRHDVDDAVVVGVRVQMNF